jgi:hypothetical protein
MEGTRYLVIVSAEGLFAVEHPCIRYLDTLSSCNMPLSAGINLVVTLMNTTPSIQPSLFDHTETSRKGEQAVRVHKWQSHDMILVLVHGII